jgi:hypothetical protein
MKAYNKEELFNYLDKINITRDKNQIITKYNGNVIKVANVSSKYEIFDIVSYLKDKVEYIESNFKINAYKLVIKGGVQSLQLISDEVEIGGSIFYKSFYILNSTDKTRKLNFSLGLHSKNGKFYAVGKNNSFVKKHLKGVTESAESASDFNVESFDSQIESISSLVGHKIKLSKLREVILGDSEDVPKINHRKFDAFKNSIRWSSNIKLTEQQRSFLYKYSEDINEIKPENDFYLDAFWTFQVYLNLFNKEDSHIVKNETERIMKITQWYVRNEILESLIN